MELLSVLYGIDHFQHFLTAHGSSLKLAITVISVIIIPILIRKWLNGGWCYSTVKLSGKTVIVTGANTGIGKETARDLFKRGARVILACRDLDKAAQAAREIESTSPKSDGRVLVRHLDLANLESIYEFAKDILTTEAKIDILINNAGLMTSQKKTDNGFDMIFGTNHLGPFLLTNLLLNKIKDSAPSRIVNVSSLAHTLGRMHWDDLNMNEKGTYTSFSAYCQSKLANILFTKELASILKGTGVSVYALHPGAVGTEFGRYTHEFWSKAITVAISVIAPLYMKTPEQGAQTTIHCAVSEKVANETGLYYSDCDVKKPSKLAMNEEHAKKLWTFSAEMIWFGLPVRNGYMHGSGIAMLALVLMANIVDFDAHYTPVNRLLILRIEMHSRGVIVILSAIKKWLDGGWCYSTVMLPGKTVIVTGANTGIGKETARNLFRRGAKVILACRDLSKATKAAQEINATSRGSEGQLVIRRLDLANFDSIYQFAEDILTTEDRIDILINNAGLMTSQMKTDDGFDMVFGTNHLGHFLLTNLLLDKIKESAPSRIINVSSRGHEYGHMHWDDLNMSAKKVYTPFSAYCQKLASRLEGTGVNVYSLHPGAVGTELTRHTHEFWSKVLRVVLYLAAPLYIKTPEQGVTVIPIAIKKWLNGGWCYSTVKLSGKTIIVTGANTGIGKETARAKVILACRDMIKAAKAAHEITTTSPGSEGQLLVRSLDLASFDSIYEFAEDILTTEDRIDILINNAGLMTSKMKTADGFDMIFGTNHLGHFLLTNLLLDKIKDSAPSRIINVSSLAHEYGHMHWDDLNMSAKEVYTPFSAYCQSKLANILFTKELASRLEGTGVSVYSLNPGAVDTEFGRYTHEFWPRILRFAIAVFGLIYKKTSIQGAQTTIHCAIFEKAAYETGLYYSDCVVKKPSKLALNEDDAKILWTKSAEMVKVILACRDMEKGTQAAREIESTTHSTGSLVVRYLDLANFNSIREFAKDILTTETRINILVNNAGYKRTTVDGFDTVFQTNHLGPFLLTNLLLDKIKVSKPSRIINLTSIHS
uniref:Uncharacterized protein n=1 Tax=Strigamia maritima TaxID=126957 RepID=T1J5Y6_STRMM